MAKLHSCWLAVYYREAHGTYARSGILFHYGPPLRYEDSVTRKVTRASVRIKPSLQERLYLGNLGAGHDWGLANDQVEIQRLMPQQKTLEYLVIAIGVQCSLRDFANAVCAAINVPIRWQGTDLEERGLAAHGRCVVPVDPRYFCRPEVDRPLCDPTGAREKPGWKPIIRFSELIREMAQEYVPTAQRDNLIRRHGLQTNDCHA